MDWMDCKQYSSNRNCYVLCKNDVRYHNDQTTDTAMKQDIDQVISPGTKSMKIIVQTNRGNTDRTVRTMAATVSEWCAPEVIEQDI